MPPDEIAMESRLSLIPAMAEKLRSDPELRSRIDGRETAFCVAVSETLANAITYGNHNDPAKKVYIRCTFEPDALSIVIRDEEIGCNPEEVVAPRDVGEDRKRGISLMRSCLDEIQFRNHGTEIYMRMNGHQRP
jgi:anti-sigma regulatory factor (Ser/Thr protein kinase)